MDYAIAADLIVFIHLLYASFAVGGELIILVGAALRWPWISRLPFRLIHLGSVLLVAAESLLGILCPLTVWENDLRRLAGQRVDQDITFVGRLIRKVIFYDFPSWVFILMYVGFAALVLMTMIIIPPRKKKDSD